ncbi:MAG: DUF5301 domain-containing protein [Desulfitobacterium sp.]
MSGKKPVVWVMIALAIAIGGMAFTLISNPANQERDLSFLNPDNLATLLMQGEGVQIDEAGYPYPIVVSGVELGKWLYSATDEWKGKKVSSPYELTPSLSIKVNEDNEIRFFAAEPTLAMIQSGDQYRHYAIPKEDFRVIQEVALLGYPKMQSLTITEWKKGEPATPVTITDSSIMEMAVLLAQGEENFLAMKYSSVNDTPIVDEYIRVDLLGQEPSQTYYIYTKDGKNYYIERPYQRINRISSDTAHTILSIIAKAGSKPKEASTFDVEHSLTIILSSPLSSSNPQDYIRAHEDEYENILKLGGEEAMQYMLYQFEQGNGEGLRGQIMMRLCKDILGTRNTIIDESLSPQEWYTAYSKQEMMMLPDYTYDGEDELEKLVYSTETARYSQPQRGFTVVAPKIFMSSEEGDLLKVFVTTYSATYIIKTASNNASIREVSGGIIPSAITFKRSGVRNYELVSYEQAKDGSEWLPSIRSYSTTPVSGREISGLADEIISHYGDYEDLHRLQNENLLRHLQKNGVKNPVIVKPWGSVGNS